MKILRNSRQLLINTSKIKLRLNWIQMGIPFFTTKLSDTAIQAVVDVLASGWLTSGKQVVLFEREFEKFIGGNINALAVNSATAGLHLALEAYGVGPDDEVIVPTLTFTASAEVVRYLGAKVVLVDIDPKTLSGDFTAIETAITPRTKAIIFVHFGGYPVDIAPLLKICKRHGLRLIEDAAHAIPSRRGNKHIGTTGSDAAVFSFYANKTMTTGEGGMIVTANSEIARRCKLMRSHGIDRDVFARFTGKSCMWRYDVVDAGYKYNLTDIAAAIGRAQLAEVDALRDARMRIVAWYDAALEGAPLSKPPRPGKKEEHSWHLYPIQLHGGSKARERVTNLFAKRDIGYSVHYTPLHKLTYWSEVARIPQKGLPNADAYFDGCLSLPIFPTMTEAQSNQVVETLKEAVIA
jgi:dTDP-4-amino-4,6-dideoxygalactose transaminase